MAHAKSITLTKDDKTYLISLTHQRTTQAQIVNRAKMLLYKERGESNKAIAERIDVNINTVKLCIAKFKDGGIKRALFDDHRSGRPVEITDDAIAWVIDIACQRPTELGYAQELWTLKNLHKHIQNNAKANGYDRLATITKPMVQKILKRSDIKPFKIKYYCEKRDPEFEEKMHKVLVVYKEISLQLGENGTITTPKGKPMVHTISCDEKPGIQAIATTTEDLRPNTKNGCVYRDYEYQRLGTLSLLAGLDLLTGETIPLVSDTHKSSDFIQLLEKFDNKYPMGDVIRIICDNHSAHKSKEVRNYLLTKPTGRFVFIFTPKHGSWLNLIESFFSKMTKQMLKGIRVASKQELKNRIYLYFKEVNSDPIIYHWTYKMDEISDDEISKNMAT